MEPSLDQRTRDPRTRTVLVWVLAFLLWSPGCGGAQRDAAGERPYPGTPYAAPRAERGLFLWQVERGGAVSHVFGTVHVGIRLGDLSPVIAERLDRSHTLVVEADTDGPRAAGLFARMLLPAGQSLRAMLGEERWRVLARHLGHVYDPSVLERLAPWVVQSMLSLDEAMLASGAPSLDSELVARARQKDKPVVFLETVESQIELLSEVIDIHDLEKTLDDVPRARRELHVLVRAYQNGNLAALESIVLDPADLAKSPGELERLLFARNRAWMPVLEPLLARGGVFVGVGAAHYFGDDGLLALLERAGFRVTRVYAAGW